MRLALCLAFILPLSSALVLETAKGRVQGSLRVSRDKREFYAFTSIPYAKPPTGERRFKSPEPFGSWEDVRDCTGDISPACNQILFYMSHLRNVTLGQEDCLYLNIYTPKTEGKMPVLVYIHGGGWRQGHPGPVGRAEPMMDEDIVLVDFTYRLGALGFLTTEDGVIPGNLGLKDQVVALKWIKENIKDFGGDPESITIFGESAGGASVHYHMMSPLSKGLFKRAISESGTSSSLWAWSNKGEAETRGLRVAEHLHCPTDSNLKILDCLRTKSDKEITEAEHIFNFIDFDPAVVFQPVVEDPSIPGAFLTKHPMETETSIPWITGITSAEGAIKLASLLQGDPKEARKFQEQIEKYLPEIMMFRNRTADEKEMSKRILEHYGVSETSPLSDFTTLFSDGFIFWPSMLSTRRHTGPQYYYYMDHRGEVSLTDLSGPKDLGDLGVSHADELLYLFNFKDVIPKIKGTDVDRKISKKIIKLWVNFAKFGNPTPDGDLEWKELGEEQRYLHMKTEEFVMSKRLKEEAVKFWDDLSFNFPTGYLHPEHEL